MNNQAHSIDYLTNQLSEKEKLHFEQELNNSAQLKEEFEEYAQIVASFDHLPSLSAPQSLKINFATFLEQEIKLAHKPPVRTLWSRWAVAATFLVIAGLGYHLWTVNQTLKTIHQELVATKNTLAEALSQTSTSVKVKAISSLEYDQFSDQELKRIILDAFLNEESPNVRLVALESLLTHFDDPQVKSVLLQQLTVEKDPFIQISLLNFLAKIKSPDAIPALEIFLQREDVSKKIKGEAFHSLNNINSI